MTINERLASLRKVMEENHVDMVYVPTNDYHLSEYVGSFFKEREYITGFNGSAGVAVITLDLAHLWVDGRYFLQGENQVKGTAWTLEKMGEKGVPTVKDFIVNKLKENYVLALDKKVIETELGKFLNEKTEAVHGKILDIDLIGKIWSSRPEMSKSQAFLLDEKQTGISRSQKIKELQEDLKKQNLDYTLLATLDDVNWLFNIRGFDIDYCPVLLSYALVGQNSVTFYAQTECLSEEIKNTLAKENIIIKPYFDAYNPEEYSFKNKKVALDEKRINYALYSLVAKNNEVVNIPNLTEIKKAKKNSTEVENLKTAHLKDGVALTKCIYWLKTDHSPKDEISVCNKLHEFRTQQAGFMEDSFETICGWKENGAIIHYEPSEATNTKITTDSFLLIDSGGHYYEGTTDVTRTVSLGKITPEMKKNYTLVLKGHLNLLNAIFIKGMSGANLDILARLPLFQQKLNYRHGTGHGVGYLLNVHEGPNGVSYNRYNVPLEEGMVNSDEPGFYLENQYGIRIESLMVVSKYSENEYGTLLKNDVLTLAPFDHDSIDENYLNSDEIIYLNNYQKLVYEKLSPLLSKEESEWLKKETRPF